MSDQTYIPKIRGVPLGKCSLTTLKQERKETIDSLSRIRERLAAIDLAIRAKEDAGA